MEISSEISQEDIDIEVQPTPDSVVEPSSQLLDGQQQAFDKEDEEGEAAESLKVVRCGPRCCGKRQCTTPRCVLVYYMVLGTVGITAVGILVALGIGVVGPYKYTLNFQRTICEVTQVNITGRINCSFRKGRYSRGKSTYPCLKIFVSFQDSNRTTHTTMLRNTEYDLHGKSSCSKIPQCSSYTNANDNDINHFRDVFGRVGHLYPCFFNPEKPDAEVIRIRRAESNNLLVNAMIWPSMIIFICLVGAVVVYWQCGCKCCIEVQWVRERYQRRYGALSNTTGTNANRPNTAAQAV